MSPIVGFSFMAMFGLYPWFDTWSGRGVLVQAALDEQRGVRHWYTQTIDDVASILTSVAKGQGAAA
jgi:hypothetical protein